MFSYFFSSFILQESFKSKKRSEQKFFCKYSDILFIHLSQSISLFWTHERCYCARDNHIQCIQYILIIFLKISWHPLPTQTFYWGLRLFVSRSKKNVFNSDFTTNKVDGGSRENNNIAIYRFYSEMNFIQDRKMYV